MGKESDLINDDCHIYAREYYEKFAEATYVMEGYIKDPKAKGAFHNYSLILADLITKTTAPGIGNHYYCYKHMEENNE